MFKDFIDELIKVLNELGVDDTERYVDDYTVRYNTLRASGKSEFESVLALGDPIADAHAIAGHSYTANEQIANNLLDEAEQDSASAPELDITKDDKAQKPFTNGEKAFYGVLIAAAACLIIAFLFITALIGIISVGYLFLAWFDFSGVNSVIVFGFAIIGLLLFAVFGITAAAMSYKIYRFTADNYFDKKLTV